MNEDKLLKSLTELHEDLLWLDGVLEFEEDTLNKAAHYWKNKNPKKYAQMLKKLKKDRKTPGHKERATQPVLQAKRRENGSSGTTSGQHGKHGHSKGHMKSKTGTAAKRYASAEKKAGSKLSIDRKNNDKGYESSNTRLVPQRLNNGSAERKDKKKWIANHNKKKK